MAAQLPRHTHTVWQASLPAGRPLSVRSRDRPSRTGLEPVMPTYRIIVRSRCANSELIGSHEIVDGKHNSKRALNASGQDH